MVGLSWLAERTNKLLFIAALAQLWALPSLIWLRTDYTAESPKWLTWGMLTLLVSKPSRKSLNLAAVDYSMPLQVVADKDRWHSPSHSGWNGLQKL